MADFTPAQGEGVPQTMRTRYRDMGDGTHALVLNVNGSSVDLDAGAEVDLAAGAVVDLAAGAVVGIVDAAGDRAGVDDIVGALHAISVLHSKIHAGNTFFVSFKTADGAPLADDATLSFALTSGAKTLHIVSTGLFGGDGEKEYLEGSTITGGTATTVYNRDRASLTATTVTVVRDPTVNAPGTLIDNQFIPGGTGGKSLGGTSGPRNEWIFKASTIYVIRLTNRAGNAQPASLAVEWYEED